MIIQGFVYRSKLILAFTLTLFLHVMRVQGHGEDKLGPHGGYIRMPGAFHLEVIKEKEGFRVYLLDMNWKNPSTADSMLIASIYKDKKKVDLECSRETNSYFCKSNLNEGQLEIVSQREGVKGALARYILPLRIENKHSSHVN